MIVVRSLFEAVDAFDYSAQIERRTRFVSVKIADWLALVTFDAMFVENRLNCLAIAKPVGRRVRIGVERGRVDAKIVANVVETTLVFQTFD